MGRIGHGGKRDKTGEKSMQVEKEFMIMIKKYINKIIKQRKKAEQVMKKQAKGKHKK